VPAEICSDPLPDDLAFDPDLWPDAGPDGNTVLSPKAAAAVLRILTAIADYKESRDAKRPAPAPTASDAANR
jgi:hypothetical protein